MITRVLTALLLLLILVPAILWAPMEVLAVIFLLIATAGAWEWSRLLGCKKSSATLYVIGILLWALGLWFNPAWASIAVGGALLFWSIYVPWALYAGVRKLSSFEKNALLLAGFLVFSACWLALMMVHVKGITYMLSLLVTVWLADSAAYFVGKTFGRRKLAPQLSPGKTLEGALGGFVFVLTVSAIVAYWGRLEPTFFGAILAKQGWGIALLSTGLLVAVSIVGDIFESLQKRQAGVKDSGSLLPGHGGVLDRIDALLPTLPLALLLGLCGV